MRCKGHVVFGESGYRLYRLRKKLLVEKRALIFRAKGPFHTSLGWSAAVSDF